MTCSRAAILVMATDATGEELPRRAARCRDARGELHGGLGLPSKEEWHAALREGREPDDVPWPVEDVHVRTPANATK